MLAITRWSYACHKVLRSLLVSHLSHPMRLVLCIPSRHACGGSHGVNCCCDEPCTQEAVHCM